MPIGIQRLNARHSQPNPHIVFIKPLKGPDEHVARQFLERIAAQCVPIMRREHISVMTLEEYEPNAEFVGRNFNAGEVIQLVLKTRGPRRERQWLPFPYVQMVMMHELAHCKQMNHSRAFWAVRNEYASEMRKLWTAKYTGEGIWGRGAVLGSSGTPLYERNVVADTDEALLVEHLCGGTYRSRGRKRKAAKEQLTYREREDRRVRRKFGTNGVALGDDLNERARLEAPKTKDPLQQTTLSNIKTETKPTIAAPKMTKAEQKRLATKPRVAVSKRGRDLRAAAALARFDQAKKESNGENDDDERLAIKREEEIDLSDDDYEDDPSLNGPDAIDIDGSRLVDEQGRGMVRVCEDMGGSDHNSGADDADARRELRELMQGGGWAVKGNSDRARNPELYAIPPWVGPPDISDILDESLPQSTAVASAPTSSSTPTLSAAGTLAPRAATRRSPSLPATKTEPATAAASSTAIVPTTRTVSAPVKTEPTESSERQRVQLEQLRERQRAQLRERPIEPPVEQMSRVKMEHTSTASTVKNEPGPTRPVITIRKLAPAQKRVVSKEGPEAAAEKTKDSKADAAKREPSQTTPPSDPRVHHGPPVTVCGVCSYANDGWSITCQICSHVLLPDCVPDAWSCTSEACRPAAGAVQYLNSPDCGVCGVCFQRRA